MDSLLNGWLACPRCGGELGDADEGGVLCGGCGTPFALKDGLLDLVDASQKVSSEGPGDTLAMAWRRRRWDELRGPAAPENAAYLAAIWERLRPDDQVLDLACGPGSFLGWMAQFAPELAILGIDLSWGALEEARRVVGSAPNVRLARASTRRRLPVKDGSCDVVLRRLAPGLPEEIVRTLRPGGYYLRFTFGPGHWREIYDVVPGLPRAREDATVAEADQLRRLGLEVSEPIREMGSEEFSLPAVLLALRSNPAAFHSERLDLTPIRELWRRGGSRVDHVSLSTEFVVLVARRPREAELPTPAPKRARARKQAEVAPLAEPVVEVAADLAAAPKPVRARRALPVEAAEPTVEAPEPKPKRTRARPATLAAAYADAASATEAARAIVAADSTMDAKPKRVRRAAAAAATEASAAAEPVAKAKRRRAAEADRDSGDSTLRSE